MVRRMNFGFAFPQTRGTAPDLHQFFEHGRILRNSPDKMVAAAAEHVQRVDTVLSQKLFNCFHDRLLNRKDALRIDKRFRRIVEVDVFNIEIRDQCVVIPERTANFKTTIQKRI